MPRNANQSKFSNYSMDFDGSSQYIDLGESVLHTSSATVFTLSAWIKPKAGMSLGIIAADAPAASPTNGGFWIGYDNRNTATRPANGISYNIKTSTGYQSGKSNDNAITLNTWNHVVLVLDGQATLYINGASSTDRISDNIGDLVTQSHELLLGTEDTLTFEFNGQIGEVAIFDYALSLSQVTTLWGGGTSVSNPMALPSPPIAYYPLGTSAWNGEYLAENNAIGDYVFDFDGSDDVNAGHIDFFDSSTTLSISGWFNFDDISVNRDLMSQWVGNTTNGSFSLRRSSGNLLALFIRTGSSSSGSDYYYANLATSSTGHSVGVWYHLAVTLDNGTCLIYLNGQALTTSTGGSPQATLQASTADFKLGYWQTSTTSFDGKMSNIKLWSSKLEATEIETLYNYGSPIQTLASIPQNSNIQGWWKLDASDTYDSSTGNWTIEDHAGSNDGTSSGMSQANLVQSDLQTVAPYSKYAMNFLGTDNDYIDCGNSALTAISGGSTTLTTTMTISTWFKLGSSSASKGLVGFGDLNNNYGGLAIRHESGVFSFLRSNQHMVSGGYSFSDTTNWHNMVFVYDPNSASNCKVYIDSVNVNLSFVNVGDVSLENKKLTIGAYYGLSDTFTGELSNFSTWNAALTSVQVSEIYNEGLPSNLNSHSAYSNLVSWWQLGENSSFDGNDWIVADEKGSNNGDGQNMTEANLTNGVGTTANGVSSGMSEGNLVGDAPYSTANALSTNMVVTSRVTGSGNTP